MTTSEDIRNRIISAGRDGAYLREDEREALDHEIDGFVSRIRQYDDLSAAEESLMELGQLEELLALLLFKYHAEVSQKQKSLVREFDRSDDPRARALMFRAIKEGAFPGPEKRQC